MGLTSKQFPYPESGDNPNIPEDFQLLAEKIDSELDKYALTTANTTYHLEGDTSGSDVNLQLIAINPSSTDTIQFRAGSGLLISWNETDQRITLSAGADLAAIEALTGTSGLLKKTAADTWTLDTATYSTTSHNHTLNSLSNVTITNIQNGEVLKWNGTAWVNSTDNTASAGTGDVTGPASSTDTAIARFSGTGGKTIQNSGVTIDVNNNIVTAGDLAVNGGDVTTTSATATLFNTNATTLNIGNAGTSIVIGATTGTTQVRNLQLGSTTSTTDGRIAWDSTYHHGVVGDGTNTMFIPTFRVQTTAKTGAYPLVTSDTNTLVQMNASAAFTVPASAGFPAGSQIHLVALTTGVTVTGASSAVLINGAARNVTGLSLRAAYSSATLINLDGANNWLLVGDLS